MTADDDARRARVLVVDDDARNRALLRAFLESRHDVVEAEDGAGALALLEGGDVDLVLLDVMMPGMTGFEVCRRIKQGRAPDADFLPVLLVTALHEQAERNRGLEAGADDFLSKPVDRRELLLRVRTFLRLRWQTQTISRQLQDLRRLDALKSDLVSLLVHDLRNPLAGVMALLTSMEQAAAGEEREDLSDALHAAGRMREVLDDLLDVQLLEDGTMTLLRTAIHADAFVRAAVRAVEGVARGRGVTLAARAPENLRFQGDEKLLRRALENLLVNAVRYSRPGAAVDVVLEGSAGAVVLQVCDRGPGVPDELKPLLFQKFGSIEAARGQARRGVGLGLYLVRLAATAHGGEATALNREGGGAVFRVTLPQNSLRPAEAAP